LAVERHWLPAPESASGAHVPWRWLGPGLITGASDDDPSGIATYSQVGAQFGQRAHQRRVGGAGGHQERRQGASGASGRTA